MNNDFKPQFNSLNARKPRQFSFNPFKKNNTDLFFLRIKTRLQVLKDKYLNWQSIVKLLLPLIIGMVCIGILSGFVIIKTYAQRIISDPSDIPSELKDGVLVLNYNDILNNNVEVNKVYSSVSKLYETKKINKIYLFILSDFPTHFDADSLIRNFEGVPKENITIDSSQKEIATVCKTAKTRYSLDKFLAISYVNYLIRLDFNCNNQGIYTKGFKVSNLNITGEEITLPVILQDFIKALRNFDTI